MSKSTEILKQIKAISAKDKKYNNLINEGGEGCERNYVSEELWEAHYRAVEDEFAAEWTLETFNKKKELWNKTILSIKQTEKDTFKQIIQAQKQTGFRFFDFEKAKKLLKING